MFEIEGRQSLGQLQIKGIQDGCGLIRGSGGEAYFEAFDPGACLSNARMLRPTGSGSFLRSFPLHRTPLCAGNDRRNLLAGGRPRYGDHYSDRLLPMSTK